MKERSRRLRRYVLGEEELFDLIESALSGWPAHVSLPRIEGVPADATVRAAYHTPEGRCFSFVIEHESFGEQADGEPVMRFPLNCERVQLAMTEDRPLVRALEREVARLRGVFSDLCQDDDRVRAAYEQGIEDAARVVAAGGEGGRLPREVGTEIAVAYGTNAAVAAQVLSLKGPEVAS